MSAFTRAARRADAAARDEVDRIIAEAQQRVADFWSHEGTDYEAAAAAFDAALRAEAAGAAYGSREAS